VTIATVARTGLSIAPNFGSENLLKWLVETCERPRCRAADERDELAVSSSFDHLVGAGEQAIRHREAERLSRLEIDYHLVLHRRLDRKVARVGST
jgi:hypothetical protein